jgi:hypothetical protein
MARHDRIISALKMFLRALIFHLLENYGNPKTFPATLTVELRAATVRPSTVMTRETGKGLKLFWKKSAENGAQGRKAGK